MPWYRSKTNWAVIVASLSNIVAATTGYQLPTWFNEAAMGIIVIFLRQGVAKSGPGV